MLDNSKSASVSAGHKKLKMRMDQPPKLFIQEVLKKFLKDKKSKVEDFVLKVPGSDEYFFPDGQYLMRNYKYVRAKLSKGYTQLGATDMIFILQDRKSIKLQKGDPEMEDRIRQRVPVQEKTLRGVQSTWYSDHRSDKYKIKILEANSMTCGKLYGVSIHAGVFLGGKLLGSKMETRLMKAEERIEWGSAKDDTFSFDIELQHLPRDAKLCLAIVGLWVNPKGNKKKKKKYSHPLAWVNISVMDHNGFLRQGREVLSTWSYDDDEDEKDKEKVILDPLGTTTRNVDGNNSQLPNLVVEFLRYDKSTSAVNLQYPSDVNLIGGQFTGEIDTDVRRKWEANKEENARRLNTIARKDPLYRLEEDDCNFLREFKWYAKHQPTALPKCLSAVEWTTNNDAHLVVDMLRLWEPLSPEDSLVLLDCGFADATTRSHAVRLMKTLTNDKLLMYLLQLVQVLKYELYLDCDLARFLLERALENRRVGHFFFWYLRSEMHRPEAKIRYGLLLEAYCQGCSGHMVELKAQVKAMKELLIIADSIKPHNISKKEKLAKVHTALQNIEIGSFTLPYDPRINVINVTCPRVMDSKKLPLWLTFKNEDPKASETGDTEVNIIFKAGDDLRQDMLTLQLIRIMDQLWMSEGMDLQMNAYECVSTGDEVGMLQVVMNAKTIASIQGAARDAFKDDPLYKWLKTQNPTEPELKLVRLLKCSSDALLDFSVQHSRLRVCWLLSSAYTAVRCRLYRRNKTSCNHALGTAWPHMSLGSVIATMIILWSQEVASCSTSTLGIFWETGNPNSVKHFFPFTRYVMHACARLCELFLFLCVGDVASPRTKRVGCGETIDQLTTIVFCTRSLFMFPVLQESSANESSLS